MSGPGLALSHTSLTRLACGWSCSRRTLCNGLLIPLPHINNCYGRAGPQTDPVPMCWPDARHYKCPRSIQQFLCRALIEQMGKEPTHSTVTSVSDCVGDQVLCKHGTESIWVKLLHPIVFTASLSPRSIETNKTHLNEGSTVILL